jgi:hypothetical protein
LLISSELTCVAAVILDLLDVVLGEHGRGTPHLGRVAEEELARKLQRRCTGEGDGGARAATCWAGSVLGAKQEP